MRSEDVGNKDDSIYEYSLGFPSISCMNDFETVGFSGTTDGCVNSFYILLESRCTEIAFEAVSLSQKLVTLIHVIHNAASVLVMNDHSWYDG